MVDFQFLKTYMLDCFMKTAQPNVDTRLFLDGLMREATAYTVSDRAACVRGRDACAHKNYGNLSPHPIKQP